jgi:hypothetical protein
MVLEPTITTTNPLDTSEEDEKDSEADSNSDSEGETLQMRNGRHENHPGVRRLSERRPEPPTLQLRRTSTTSAPGTSPRVVSGLSGITHTPPQFAQLTHPGPASVAPPCLTTTPVVVTDLPYAPPTSGSSLSVRERITQLQHGEIGPDDPTPKTHSDSTTSVDSSSPVDERSSTGATTGTWKPVSLENTRYALNHQAQDMIRRLSNGPPGALRRASSPSPPLVPSGWTRPERITRTMQKQMIYRDLEQEASEQHYGVFSPNITRPDSRSEYFSVPVNENPSTASFEEDPLLSTFPRLNSELRRINKELDNVKKFSDPMADALQRLAQRKGIGSPIISSTSPSVQRTDSILSLTSSWKKRFSPDKRDSSPETSMGKSSLGSPESTRGSNVHDYHQNADVFSGERESKLREVTRQLWDSWPPRPRVQESEEVEQTEEQSKEQEDADTNSVSPTEVKTSRSQSPLERRLFTSGLRETWGSALALAGFRQS